METRFNWSGKQVLVLGLARSGVAVARQLHRLGARVTVNDKKSREQAPEAAELEQLGVRVVCGGHPAGLVHKKLDLIVKNPGIPYRIAPIQEAMQKHIPIVTEVEIAYALSRGSFIGITGSNGKTTTTTLVGEMLKAGGIRNVVAGNIGRALTEVASDTDEQEWLVAELSSFQLKGTIRFRPCVAALLNIVPAHLDYHETMEDYMASKKKLFANQTADDIAIFNADCEKSRQLASEVKATVHMFSRLQQVNRGADLRSGYICYHNQDRDSERILPVEEVALPGQHNLENALAAVAIAKACGCSTAAVAETLRRFSGVEHRLEFVRALDGVRYYNDSKATNPTAMTRTLEAFNEPIILIAGGLDRGIDFRDLVSVFRERLYGLVVYGQTQGILKQRGLDAGVPLIREAEDLEEAVRLASEIARQHDIVILSPGCASWDQYTSFEERGGIFKQAVHRL